MSWMARTWMTLRKNSQPPEITKTIPPVIGGQTNAKPVPMSPMPINQRRLRLTRHILFCCAGSSKCLAITWLKLYKAITDMTYTMPYVTLGATRVGNSPNQAVVIGTNDIGKNVKALVHNTPLSTFSILLIIKW